MSKNRNGGTIELRINRDALKDIKINAINALWMAGEALHTDLVQSQTMPRDTGTMQNDSTYVSFDQNGTKNPVALHTNTPYARRVYYHPELNFQKEKNPNAQAYWLETYISGDKKDFVVDAFKQLFHV